ncbi:MAG: tRNA (adenosine(37)-N6)-threonylcarbamoyltransferase complex dimerization subunit type 1 TsaB [bacterium]|nr:MAG: tRNA (adenosine(37)-N6)-threonylcarbamoyltransferase complex dimerization subunit type 1 TsaB [bacterium]
MIMVAADTSTPSPSVAFGRVPGESVGRSLDPGRPHSETLLPAIDGLLRDSGVGRESVQALAIGTGPGMFTGLRVGLATFQGWAYTAGLPIVPVPSLDALAWPYILEGRKTLVVSDARKGEIYAALYAGLGEDGLPLLQRAVALVRPAGLREWLGGTAVPGTVALGTGLDLAAPGLEGLGGIKPLPDACPYPMAVHVLDIAWRLLDLDRTVSPSELKPTYVRPPDAIPATGRK